MKIKSNKIIALILALALVFASVAIVANADSDSKTYIKVSSIANAKLDTEMKTITVSLSPTTTLDKDSVITIGFNGSLYSAVSSLNLSAASGECSGTKETGAIVFKAKADVANTSDAEMPLFKIDFKTLATTKGVDKLVPSLTTAKVNGGTALEAANDVVGDKLDSYRNLFGIGLNNFITLVDKDAPYTNAKVVVKFASYAGSTMPEIADQEIQITDAIAYDKVMQAADMQKFLDKNAAEISKHVASKIPGTSLTYNSFKFNTASIRFNNAAVTANTTYSFSTDEESGENVYTVTLDQLKETTATIKVVFRTAMDPKYYHGTKIPDYTTLALAEKVYEGENILTQASLIASVQDIIDTYNELGDSVDPNYAGALLNKWIVDNSGFDGSDQCDLSDFTLDKEVALFNGLKIKDGMTYSLDASQNVYTVFMDQVNVPKEVLMTIADQLGKINYTQFSDLGVLVINEAIDAFKASADSVVEDLNNWPSEKDVESKKESGAGSPGTGDLSNISGAIAVALVLTASALVIVRKKED